MSFRGAQLILVTKVLTLSYLQKDDGAETAPEEVTVQVIDITRLFGVTTKTKYHTQVQIISMHKCFCESSASVTQIASSSTVKFS